MKILTYNIRIQVLKDKGVRSWLNRKSLVAKVINDSCADIISVQEVGNWYQKWSLERLLPKYDYYGKGLQWLGIVPASECGILWNKDKFYLQDSGGFWLSETPEKYSKSWDSAFAKTCVWVKLLDKVTSKEFYVISTHLDHIGQVARKESAKLINTFIKTLDRPVLFMGDLNTNLAMNEGILELFSETMIECKDAKEVVNLIGTYNRYTDEFPVSDGRIDFIFTKGIDMVKSEVINKIYDGVFPSDHFPVALEFNIN